MLKSNDFLKRTLTVLFTTMLLSSCVSLLTPNVVSEVAKLRGGTYSLDTSHATLLFKVSHLGLSTYVGRFNAFDASLDFEPENMTNAKLDAVIEIASLDVNDDDLKDTLMGGTWFDQANYPQAVFTTTSVNPISDSEFEFLGDLTLHGVTQPISLIATFHGGANNILTGKYTLGFSAKGSFIRSDFGIDAYTSMVGDKVEIETYVEFQRN